MIEYLVDGILLEYQEAPRMNYGKYLTFKGYNLFGVEQQAVHNAGSSMMTDTPRFKEKVIEFIKIHMAFNDIEFKELIKSGKEAFYDEQKERLNRFEKDKLFRNECLKNIFLSPFEFSRNIKCCNFEVAIMLYFIKEYNYLMSTKPEHLYTKEVVQKYYPNENEFLKVVYDKLVNEEDVGYLLDICYGRYYFLELHFKFKSKGKIRSTPLSIISEFFEWGLMQLDEVYTDEDIEDVVAEKKINESEGYVDRRDVEAANNREPERVGNTISRYKTNTRLAKTVLKNHAYACDVDNSHTSFMNKREKRYMEAHHLVPMSLQKDFLPINIDREENIVCVCPNCHKAIHYGSMVERKQRILKLFSDRKESLAQCGIVIDAEKILEFYDIKK